jgi:hypothetical protein
MDDADPEARPPLEQLVAGLTRELERTLEELQLARILVTALGEKLRVKDSPLLLDEVRFGAQELPSRRVARLGRAGEERLLVEDVRPSERILC